MIAVMNLRLIMKIMVIIRTELLVAKCAENFILKSGMVFFLVIEE